MDETARTYREDEGAVTFGIPLIALRGLVVFPEMVLHFDLARKQSVDALNAAMEYGQEIFLTAQKDPAVEDPNIDDLFEIGCIAKIRQVITMPENDSLRVIVEGDTRARILHGFHGNYLYADVERIADRNDPDVAKDYVSALIRKTRDYFDEYTSFSPKMAPDVIMRVVDDDAPGGIADYIASVIPLDYELKQELLETLDPVDRLEKMDAVLIQEIELLRLETEISQKVEQNMDQNQREYYLREQMHVLSEELDGGDTENEVEEYRKKVEALTGIEDASREKLNKEINRLAKMDSSAGTEAAVIRNYLDTVLALPWGTETEDVLDLAHAREVLDKDHYGLSEVKDRIIELLAVRQLAPDITGQIICLAGPPGVGKTSIVRSLAEAMGRKYVRISLGGVRDEAEIRGHRRTYIGAMQGRVMAAVHEAGTVNPIILFDEIDKMGADFRGDPSSAMLEVLDPEQNKAFVDHYIDLPFDLSKVFFITTANDKSQIPAPLLDRMEVIDLYSYTAEEKFHIAKDHLVPKSVKRHGLTKKQLKFTDAALHHIIQDYTREAGVRLLERKIDTICRKTALQVVQDPAYTTSVKISDLEDYLGVPRYREELSRKDSVGVTNGLAWTSVGGEMLKVEAAVMDGTGRLQLTGSLGDVMKESAQAAVSYIRTNAKKLHVSGDFYKEKDIHIHVPEGAVPKDGPSAGVTIATSVLSALSGTPVKGDIAMTGEISLTGRVMPIGGLKEKTMAAYKAGMKTVIIPKENEPDLREIDETVREHLEFVPVTALDQVWKRALKPGRTGECP